MEQKIRGRVGRRNRPAFADGAEKRFNANCSNWSSRRKVRLRIFILLADIAKLVPLTLHLVIQVVATVTELFVSHPAISVASLRAAFRVPNQGNICIKVKSAICFPDKISIGFRKKPISSSGSG